MTEKSIPFKGPMVRAILEGRKTQTRRVLKPQPWQDDDGEWVWRRGRAEWYSGSTAAADFAADPAAAKCVAPYAVGDLLWVRETWRSASPLDDVSPRRLGEELGFPPIHYEADGTAENWKEWRGHDVGRLRPSIHMPRWASRIDLRVTAVKVERLQDISEEDARAEGSWPPTGYKPGTRGDFIGGFAFIWESIHGSDAWAANPWVAAITFERVKP